MNSDAISRPTAAHVVAQAGMLSVGLCVVGITGIGIALSGTQLQLTIVAILAGVLIGASRRYRPTLVREIETAPAAPPHVALEPIARSVLRSVPALVVSAIVLTMAVRYLDDWIVGFIAGHAFGLGTSELAPVLKLVRSERGRNVRIIRIGGRWPFWFASGDYYSRPR